MEISLSNIIHNNKVKTNSNPWHQATGQELFDIVSSEKLNSHFEYFDKDFYDGQNGARLRLIEEPTAKIQELQQTYQAMSESWTQLRIKNVSPLAIPSFHELIEGYEQKKWQREECSNAGAVFDDEPAASGIWIWM